MPQIRRVEIIPQDEYSESDHLYEVEIYLRGFGTETDPAIVTGADEIEFAGAVIRPDSYTRIECLSGRSFDFKTRSAVKSNGEQRVVSITRDDPQDPIPVERI